MSAGRSTDARRSLPAVDRLLGSVELRGLVELYGRELVAIQARTELESARERLAGLDESTPEAADLIAGLPGRIRRGVEEIAEGGLRRVINATGILIHTNLGRAPLPEEITDDLPGLADAGCDLEMDLGSGERSDRNRRASAMLTRLTGASGALVVNNNAGAVFLALSTLAAGREVIVSRGEMVEIGGSFRVPEIMATSGARLVEVGTTNRTHLDDYRRAIGPETGALLKVHPSNYRMTGFVSDVEAKELVALGRSEGVPLVVDEGAGLLRPRPEPQLAGHASVAELVHDGATLVCSSGDKLLGGPQAGLLVGSEDVVARCRRNPLARALRPGRLVFAALEAVLRRHLVGRPMPLDRLWPDPEAHRKRVERVVTALSGAEVRTAEAFVGGGAAPERGIPGPVVALPGGDAELSRLRLGDPAVVGYLRDDRLVLDLRTVAPRDDDDLVRAVARSIGEG